MNNPNEVMVLRQLKTPRVIVFLDLDNNVFQSGRKCPPGDVVPVAFKTTGEACGFMTGPQIAFFDWLNQTTTLIPNTARDTATYARARLPFKGYAVCSFGGVILKPNGEVEEVWHKIIESEANKAKDTLNWAYNKLLEIAEERSYDIRPRLVTDIGLDLYASVKHNQHKNEELVDLGNVISPLLPEGWTVHFNDNNLAIFPAFLGKENATRWLLENVFLPDQNTVIIGSGDSFTDIPFMAMSHFALMPSQSQVFSCIEKQGRNLSAAEISS